MSTNPKARAWVQVRADALSDNYARVRDAVAPGAGVLPMVKADAYGLGVADVVERLEPLGPWGFGVATVAEGVQLRELGVTRPIVVCSPCTTDDLPHAVSARLQPMVSSVRALEAVGRAAREAGVSVDVHLDIDTGMGRSGFDWRRIDVWLPEVLDVPTHVHWIGCSTHLHSADEGERTVHEQWSRFEGVLERAVAARPADAPEMLVHVLNSAGVFRVPERARSIVRPGIFLYGGGVGDGQPAPTPVVSVQARVALIREVPAGTTLGYGATYRAKHRERWATLTIGYGDGFPRALSNRGSAIIRGVRVPIIGRISMDVTVVDISGAAAVREGDVATLIGQDGDVERTIDEVALEAGTISYEVLTGLTRRLPRIWTDRPS